MTSRDSLSPQVRKPCISVIPVSQMIPLNPARLAHLWIEFWVIGNIITVNSPSLESFIHLWSQGFHLSSIIKSSPSSSHHHHIIITSSPQSVKITSNITSAGNYYISWKDSQSRKEKKKGVRLWIKVDLRYTSLLHNHKIAWVGRPLWTLCTGGALCTLSTVYTSSLSSFGHTF